MNATGSPPRPPDDRNITAGVRAFVNRWPWALDAAPLVWKLVRTVLFCVLMISVERLLFERYLHVPEQRLSVVAKAYQSILTFGYRAPVPRFSAIVRMDSWDTNAEPCAQRAKLNDVVRSVLRHQPRAIVVASTLKEGLSCPAGETDALLKTIRMACVSTPIFFGLDFPQNFPTDSKLQGLRLKSRDREDYCANGHTSPQEDFRLLPLCEHVGGECYGSLSWIAASTVDPALKANRAVKRFQESHDPIYTSLFANDDFRERTVTEAELRSDPTDARYRLELKGRVIVIGFTGEPEVNTNLGRVPGHILHATYVEAFLDGRLLTRIPDRWHWLLSLAFWFYVDWPNRFKLGFARVLIGLSVLMILTIVLVQFAGYYQDFSTVSIVGLFLWFSRWAATAVHEHTA